MQKVYDLIARVAPTEATVLITGETGTGKELVAQTIHELSRRHKEPFLPLNCGAVSPNLIESELFGHERGSFTGADRVHRGYFERANGGTLFLDEITEMPIELQVKLLRVLETATVTRVGGSELIKVDVRVIAATNRRPEEAVAAGQAARGPALPPERLPDRAAAALRDRGEDIELLAEHFLAMLNKQEGTTQALQPGRPRAARAALAGRATCASCATSCSAPSSWPRTRSAPTSLPLAHADRRARDLQPVGARRHVDRRGRAPPDPGDARALGRGQEEGRGDAQDQPEDALQPPERVQGGLTASSSARSDSSP